MSKTMSDVLEYLYQKNEKELADCVLKELVAYEIVSKRPPVSTDYLRKRWR